MGSWGLVNYGDSGWGYGDFGLDQRALVAAFVGYGRGFRGDIMLMYFFLVIRTCLKCDSYVRKISLHTSQCLVKCLFQIRSNKIVKHRGHCIKLLFISCQ